MSVELSDALAPSNNSDAALKQAFDQFIEQLSDDERKVYSTATLDEVLSKVNTLESHCGPRKKFKNIGQRIQPLIYNLQRYGRALDVFVQVQFTPMSLIWGALRAILEVGSAFLEYFDKLVNMLQSLNDSFGLFRQYEELLGQDARLQTALRRYYFQMLVVLRKAHKAFSTSGLKIAFRSLWRTFESDYKVLSNALATDSLRLSEEISLAWKRKLLVKIERTDEQQLVLHQKLVKQTIGQDGLQLRKGIIEWLNPKDMSIDFERERSRRDSGSGQWCLDHEKFTSWLDVRGHSKLWLCGGPGTGKTVLSTTIIEHVQRNRLEEGTSSLAFFFCNRNDNRSRSLLSVLSALVSQALSCFDSIPESVSSAYKRAQKNGRLRVSTADQLHYILKDLYKLKQFYIVIDGLDEAEEACSIIATLREIQSQSINTKLIVLSRDLQYLRRELHDYPSLRMDSDKTKNDIDSFLSRKIGCLAFPLSLQLDVYQKLSTGANGMFLWAKLMVEALHSAATNLEARNILLNLPTGLEATYDHILKDVSSQSCTRIMLFRNMMLWICYGSRSLSWAELQVAIASSPGKQITDDDLPFKDVLLDLCGPLVEYDARSQLFRLSHHSVREFMTAPNCAEKHRTLLPAGFSDAHNELAVTCLDVIATSSVDCLQGNSPRSNPLLKYAIESWCHHVTNSKFSSTILDNLVHFLADSLKRRAWIANYLFQNRKDFPLQRLMSKQKQLRLCIKEKKISLSLDDLALDWLHDVTQLLIQSSERHTHEHGRQVKSHSILQSISHFEKLMVVRDLSREYTMSNRLPQAVACMTEVLKPYDIDSSSLPIEAVWVLNSLGIFYDQQKRTNLAIETQQKALVQQEIECGKDNLETIWTVNELGRLYRHAGDLERAAASHRRALLILQRDLGTRDLQVAWTLNTLARTLRKQSYLEEAIRMHKDAIDIQKTCLGEKHPHVLWALSDIARCKRDLKLLQESADMFRAVYNDRKEVLGPFHADTLWSANDLAMVLIDMGVCEEARSLHELALKYQTIKLGAEHDHTVWTKHKLEENVEVEGSV